MKLVGTLFLQEYDDEGTVLETSIDIYETVLKIKMILSKKNGTFEWDLIDELKFNVVSDLKDQMIQRYKRRQRCGPVLPLIMKQRDE